MRRAGLPPDIIQRLRRKKKVFLDLNVIWAATADAMEFLESVIDGQHPRGRNWRKENPDVAKEIDRLRATLKLYRQLHGQVIKEGNVRNWRSGKVHYE